MRSLASLSMPKISVFEKLRSLYLISFVVLTSWVVSLTALNPLILLNDADHVTTVASVALASQSNGNIAHTEIQ